MSPFQLRIIKKSRKSKIRQHKAKITQKPKDKNSTSISDKTKNFINIASWNIHGLKKSKADLIKNRTSESEFGKLFDENDIIFSCETWRDRFDQYHGIEWDDEFQEYSKKCTP